MSTSDLLWRLDSRDQTTVVGIDSSGSPCLLWYGDALNPDTELASLWQSLEPATPKAYLDKTHLPSLLPQAARGEGGAPALEGHRSQAGFATHFVFINAQISNGSTDHSLTLMLQDEVAKLRLELQLMLSFESSVLSLQSTLYNDGDDFQLQWLASATLPLPDGMSDCLSMHGRWGKEFQQQRQTITYNRIQLENLTGRTSHEVFPGAIVGEEGFTENYGQVLGVHLGWSGNHRTIVERLSDGSAYVQTGVVLLPGEVTLSQGEHYTSATTYACAAGGLNQMSQRLHRFTRNHILPGWTRSPRPVHANSWEAVYFDHQQSTLFELVDAAASIGAERFVLDDGWFLGRRDDTTALGDWSVDTDVYPEGLAPLVARVRERGMQFGLWFEPEMISPDSELYRKHPEWALQPKGYDTPLARHQLVLDIAKPEVSDYLFSCISTLVHQHSIDYIKWDMNRNLINPGDSINARAALQPHACYTLMNRLNQQHPGLEIETCSSGGARTDYGVLQHTGRVWASDNIDPVDRLRIHRGFSLFFPPEIMGAHLGHDVAHLTGRNTSVHTRAISALQGQFGFEVDARELEATEKDVIHAYTKIYKDNRNWLSDCTAWRIPTRDKQLIASGMVSEDQTRSLWTVVAEQSLSDTKTERLVLQGLDKNNLYTVTALAGCAEAIAGFSARSPEWLSSGIQLPGELLMKTGLSLPVLPAQAGLVFECRA